MMKFRTYLPIIGVLLLAFWLRTAVLTDIPPGLTHDEANHGREALDILDGIYLFYFPLNYGSEPLYSYTVAGSMWALGESLFALRFVNVVFGTAVLAISYAWATAVFNRRAALLTAALLSVSFWPLATSRQSLRAGMLPFFMGLAVWFFWQLYGRRDVGRGKINRRTVWLIVGFGGSVAVTLHIYLASRVAWLVFPLFVLYLLLWHREKGRTLWLPTFFGLLLAGNLIIPMLRYVARHPYVLTRLDMLDRPLQDLASGNLLPILSNMAEALLAFVWPGFGDAFLAYNIPGRPVFEWLTAVFFVVGLAVCLWRWKRPSYAFVLLWFASGIVPSLITGATANTTRNLAALTPIYLIPVLGFLALVGLIPAKVGRRETAVLAALWLLIAGITTGRAYFGRWGSMPEVRGAYQHTLVAEIAYLDQQETTSPVMFSSVYPGAAHDPSIAQVLTAQRPYDSRWMDARYALLIPGAAQAIIPQSTPLHPALTPYLTQVDSVSLRLDDLDAEFGYYLVNEAAVDELVAGGETAVNFDNAITLLHSEWLTPNAAPGAVAGLLTVWRVTDPSRIGPIVPPIFTTDVVMFAQVLRPDGSGVLAQRDALDVPSWSWQPDDILIQIQPIAIPADAAPGSYPAIVGFYDRASGRRRPVLDASGQVVETFAGIRPLSIR